MSDPLNHDPLIPNPMSDELIRNRIAAGFQELDQPESDADIAAALDAIDTEPLSDATVRRILRQVQHSITTTAEHDRRENDVSLNQFGRIQPRPARSHTSQVDRTQIISRPQSAASQAPILAACVMLLVGIGLMLVRFGDFAHMPLADRNRGITAALPGELLSSADRKSHAPSTIQIQRAESGETFSTGPRERRRVALPDGSILSINEQSKVVVVAPRRIKLLAGEIFIEVVPASSARPNELIPADDRFVVETPHRQVTALGTKFVVKSQEKSTSVVVTQGNVQVSGVREIILAGMELIADQAESKSVEVRPAKRSAYVVDWIKDLMAAGGSIVVPGSEHAGGTITVVDPQGQETQLSLRKFHVDVYIEDGFARTTIDQTYFNHTWQQLEGTFRFPLPADASLSRLAMYVNGTLMEGGMVERDYGRNVFEQIRHTRRDPALLEWVDGTTFQMRVFPLEAQQEKRILLSYTQRLPSDYGKSVYRFPGGHSLDGVREWSTHIRVKGAAGTKWYSPSHLLNGRDDQGDLLLEGRDEYAELDRDLVVELGDLAGLAPLKTDSTWSVFDQDGFQYVMLRQRPELKGSGDTTTKQAKSQRHWIFLVENSADRNEILAETQRQITKVLLENSEHSDTFSMIRAGTQSESFRHKPVKCSLENNATALQFLNEVTPIGALDLEQALQAVQQQMQPHRDVWIVHLGTGIPVLGERDETVLLRLLPARARYVGVAVGKRWSKPFMETGASRSGGLVTQINPDEAVAWRAFDLLSTLNAPRLTEIAIRSTDQVVGSDNSGTSAQAAPSVQFLMLTNSLAHGQELSAVTRVPRGQVLPKSVTITGKLNGSPYSQTVAVPESLFLPWSRRKQEHGVSPDQAASQSGYLPRTWARLEIDRLVALGAAEFKSQIIELSKAMYVMSPFTSLLVLETEAMYAQFNVDRGRKDHWAMYPAPPQIPVVTDQGPAQLAPLDAATERLKLTEARAKTAQLNYERGVAEKRPVTDLKRLERLKRAEQAEVKLNQNEIQRIQQAIGDAADPVRQAWNSVIFRRSAWQQYSPQNFWAKHSVRFVDDFNGAGASKQYVPLFGLSKQELFGLPALQSALSQNRWDVDGQDFDKVLRMIILQAAPSGTGSGVNDSNLWGRRHSLLPEQMADNGALTNMYLSFNGMLMDGTSASWNDAPQSWVDGAYFGFSSMDQFGETDVTLREERFDKIPILDPVNLIEWSVDQVSERPFFDFALQQLILTQNDAHQQWPRSAAEQYLRPIDVRDMQDQLKRINEDEFLRTPNIIISDFDESELLMDVDEGPIRFPTRSEWQQLSRRHKRRLAKSTDLNGNGIVYDSERLERYHADLPLDLYGLGQFDDDLLRDLTTNDLDYGYQQIRKWHISPRGVRYVRRRHDLQRVWNAHPVAGVLNDLPGYAPGLQTWFADRLAIVEQSTSSKPQSGEVDAEARRLIEKARSLGWEKVQLKGTGKNTIANQHGNLLIADGTGRFVLNREVGEGLKEAVINDGSILWHLYPEIGLGAKRTLNRFHLPAIESLLPWFVPEADDLSVGANIKTIGPRTIRITSRKHDRPAGNDATKTEPTHHGAASRQPLPASAPHEIAVEIVFFEEGGLSERRMIDLTSCKLLVNQTVSTDGTVQVFDAENKLVAVQKYDRQPIEAPNLVPVTNDLVVLPLPYRTSTAVPVSVPVNLQTNAPDFAKLSDDDALKLLATYFAEARQAELTTFIEQRFTARGDHRIGFAVLMASIFPESPLVANATKQHPGSPLATFLELFSVWISQGHLNGNLNAGDGASPFLKRVCSVYNLYSRWATDRAATRERSFAEIERDLEAMLLVIRECRSLDLAVKLLSTVRASFKRVERMNATCARLLNATAAAIADEHELPEFGRTARIEWLLWIRDDASVVQAQELFRAQLADAISLGLIPELSSETWSAFIKPDCKSSETWRALVKEAAGILSDKKRHFAQIQMARRCVTLGEPALAAEIFHMATQDQDLAAKPLLNLAALEYAKEAGDWAQAEVCVQRALAEVKLQQVPRLWRDAAAIARQLHKFNIWIECLDRAYELEFAALPKTVNLDSFRQDYESLFGQLDERTGQLVDAKISEKLSFSRIVQRAAARWRDIDMDDTAACHHAAKILTRLGLVTAAWNYWTTPLAESPDHSTAWMTFANAMNSEQRFLIADRAWSTAFDCEPTNPQILLQHAQFLLSTKQVQRARDVLTKITTSTWQPRFDDVKNQAQVLITGAPVPPSDTPQ